MLFPCFCLYQALYKIHMWKLFGYGKILAHEKIKSRRKSLWPYFIILDHCTLGYVSVPKLPAHYAGDKHVLPAFPSSLVSMAKKNTDREDFWGANHLRMDNGRDRSVQP